METPTNIDGLPEKVALIIPPSAFLSDERVFMSLGLLKVAATLERADVKVDVLDLSGFTNYTDIVEDYIKQNPQVFYFGITSTSPQMPATAKIIEVIRKCNQKSKIILGGPHATLVNTAFRKERSLGLKNRATRAMEGLEKLSDVVVAGDGEKAIFIALSNNPPKIVDADITNSPLFLKNEELNESPWPARHLVDVNSYKYFIEDTRAISLIAQLGCPFACGFCGGRESPAFRRIRTRTSENIVDEMTFLHREYGFNGFMMYDDELNVNPTMIELMDLIAKRQRDLGVSWKLRGFIKSQLFTDEQAISMYKAGFRWILVGFESGSEEILSAINKKATRSQNTNCMEIARRNGLKVKALMSIGHPGESFETTKETEKWLLDVKPDDFDVTVITCYPGTPYYDQAIKVSDDTWAYTCKPSGAKLYQKDVDFLQTAEFYKGDPNGEYKAFVYTDFLTSIQIVMERDRLERHIREKLGIPFSPSAESVRYEHSMGQGFPSSILRSSNGKLD